MEPYYSHDGITLYYGSYEEALPQLRESVGAVITDPPFGIGYQNNYTHEQHEKLEGDSDYFSYHAWGKEAFRLLRPDAALFAYTGWSEYPHHYNELQQCDFVIKEPLIVQKRPSGKTDLYGSFQSNADWIIFAHKGKFKFRPTELVRNKKAGVVPNKGRKPVPEFKTRLPACWFGDQYPWSTENPAAVKRWKHPTIKTVQLLQWLVLLSTDPGDVILDPFAGSGSTLLAARQMGRRAIGIEIKKEFCDLIVERLNND